ncbi:MAG: DUF4339 domain-containing protein [Prevotella sp.]|nr:DUF4339 domain-containing protein [Prevotella sp.]
MEYFIAQGSENLGPFTIDQLRERGISPDTEVWTDGMEEWQPAYKVTELQTLFEGIDTSVYAAEAIAADEDSNSLGSSFLPALGHAFYTIIYLLFVLPFDLWRKAIIRLAKQKRDRSLRIMGIKTEWPLLSFIKRYIFEFLFDFVIFLSYFVGLIIAIISYTKWISDIPEYLQPNFFDYIKALLFILLPFYNLPVFISLFRDICQISLLPIRKLISWFRKPAQYYDLKVK